MRSTGDRIRHAVSFELIALFIVTPVGALGFDEPLYDVGVLVVISATIATCWNYLYNLVFDHALLRLKGSVRKTLPARIVHALLFEGGLLLVLLPVIAWYLGIGLVKAFLMDASFAAFYLVYAFAFNWAYDIVFPVPGAEHPHHAVADGGDR